MDKQTSIYLGILSGIGTYLMPIYTFEWIVRVFADLFIGNTKIKLAVASIIALIIIIVFTVLTLIKLKENKIFIKAYLAIILFGMTMYILRISLIIF